MQIKGKVFSGVLRGSQFIEKYAPRLKGLLQFTPYSGTLDVKLDEKMLDIRPYATKSLEHVLLDGSIHRDAWLAPLLITVEKKNEKQTLECWAIQFEHNIYKHDVLEIIAKQHIRETLHIEDGDQIMIEFTGRAETVSQLTKLKIIPKKK